MNLIIALYRVNEMNGIDNRINSIEDDDKIVEINRRYGDLFRYSIVINKIVQKDTFQEMLLMFLLGTNERLGYGSPVRMLVSDVIYCIIKEYNVLIESEDIEDYVLYKKEGNCRHYYNPKIPYLPELVYEYNTSRNVVDVYIENFAIPPTTNRTQETDIELYNFRVTQGYYNIIFFHVKYIHLINNIHYEISITYKYSNVNKNTYHTASDVIHFNYSNYDPVIELSEIWVEINHTDKNVYSVRIDIKNHSLVCRVINYIPRHYIAFKSEEYFELSNNKYYIKIKQSHYDYLYTTLLNHKNFNPSSTIKIMQLLDSIEEKFGQIGM